MEILYTAQSVTPHDLTVCLIVDHAHHISRRLICHRFLLLEYAE